MLAVYYSSSFEFEPFLSQQNEQFFMEFDEIVTIHFGLLTDFLMVSKMFKNLGKSALFLSFIKTF